MAMTTHTHDVESHDPEVAAAPHAASSEPAITEGLRDGAADPAPRSPLASALTEAFPGFDSISAQQEAPMMPRRKVEEESSPASAYVGVYHAYLAYCARERRLDRKTIGAYRRDIAQFLEWAEATGHTLDRASMRAYLAHLNGRYAASSVRRKMAAVRAWTNWLCREDYICVSPFEHLDVSIRQPVLLPRTIGPSDLRRIMDSDDVAHEGKPDASSGREERGEPAQTTLRRTLKQDERHLRDQAVLELLIATGARVSEICSLDLDSVDLDARVVRIWGKGSRERVVYLGSQLTVDALESYLTVRLRGLKAEATPRGAAMRMANSELALRGPECRVLNGKNVLPQTPDGRHASDTRGRNGVSSVGERGVSSTHGGDERALFLSSLGKRLSEQAVRKIIEKRANETGVRAHITPHMFRHTFATLLLENDVDIRFIQTLLGHSSIRTTERYTHAASAKLKELLENRNPRDMVG